MFSFWSSRATPKAFWCSSSLLSSPSHRLRCVFLIGFSIVIEHRFSDLVISTCMLIIISSDLLPNLISLFRSKALLSFSDQWSVCLVLGFRILCYLVVFIDFVSWILVQLCFTCCFWCSSSSQAFYPVFRLFCAFYPFVRFFVVVCVLSHRRCSIMLSFRFCLFYFVVLQVLSAENLKIKTCITHQQ